jgi:16S rRNA (cytosine967-C5)-methyltransferase
MSLETPGAAAGAGEGAPALRDVLQVAAAAWQRFESGQSLDRALALSLREPPGGAAAGPAFAGAARDLVSAAVRRRARLEYLIAELAQRPPAAPLRALLAVALAQLLAQAYPAHTLVDQAVQAARAQASSPSAPGFVNAVLRAFLRRRAALEAQAGADPARRWNLPPWWLERLRDEYGARADALLVAQLEEPPLVLRVNRRRATVQRVLARLHGAGLPASRVGAAAVWLQRALPVQRIPGFAQGEVSVQDAGAQLAAPWLAPAAGQRVLDACAAPGGKTAHLLELADCRVDAVEIDPERAARVVDNLRRLGFEPSPSGAGPAAQVRVADLLDTAAWWDGQAYDRILLDAPCTASGVLRRHPDAAWLRRPADVANLATRQAKMLDTLWPLLAPAGRLLYVVCSVFAEEGRRQIAAFVRRQPGARRLPLPLAGLPEDPGGVQLLPAPLPAPLSALQSAWQSAPPAGADPASASAASAAVPLLHDGFYFALIEKI